MSSIASEIRQPISERTFTRSIEKAGVEPWGKPWQNLRASRETELTQEFLLHVCCDWLGNSQPVALKHYLHVLDSDFEKAIAPASEIGAYSVQQPSASGGNGRKSEVGNNENTPELQGVVMACDDSQNSRVTPQGFEP